MFTDIDFEDIQQRYSKVSGSGLRNQLYYQGMTHSGLKGKGANKRAPAYYIAAAEAAFPYGKALADLKDMPAAHRRAYEQEESPTVEEVDELITSMTAAHEVQCVVVGVGVGGAGGGSNQWSRWTHRVPRRHQLPARLSYCPPTRPSTRSPPPHRSMHKQMGRECFCMV